MRKLKKEKNKGINVKDIKLEDVLDHFNIKTFNPRGEDGLFTIVFENTNQNVRATDNEVRNLFWNLLTEYVKEKY